MIRFISLINVIFLMHVVLIFNWQFLLSFIQMSVYITNSVHLLLCILSNYHHYSIFWCRNINALSYLIAIPHSCYSNWLNLDTMSGTNLCTHFKNWETIKQTKTSIKWDWVQVLYLLLRYLCDNVASTVLCRYQQKCILFIL